MAKRPPKKSKIMIPKVETYQKDRRWSLEQLYTKYRELEEAGWIVDTVYVQDRLVRGSRVKIPVYALRTKKQGLATWVIAGVHGEEPAGPIAIVKRLDDFKKFASLGLVFVIFPMLNPTAYADDMRYWNTRRNMDEGVSVGDFEHVLPHPDFPKEFRRVTPACEEAELLAKYMRRIAKLYPPISVFDFHEDEDRKKSPYIYSQGETGVDNPIAKEVVEILTSNGMPLQMSGRTRFGQMIEHGVVYAEDGSIEHWIAHSLHAPSIITVETPTIKTLLDDRVNAHGKVISQIDRFFKMASKQR